MKPVAVLIALLSSLAIAAFNPFKGASRSLPTIEEQVNLSVFTHEFDPTAILESRPRNSEIYTKAMIELKRLESEQTCHRLAAQLLMNNCRDVKEMSNDDSQLSNAQNHHVESFANGLTLCDLSRGKFVVSEACYPFTASALLRVYQGGKGKLDVSHAQTTACIESFGKDHSQWLTWVKHRDNALMFCRAVRLDIDKDETINLHKELTRLMAEFAEGLDLDIQYAKKSMAEHIREMESQFEGVLNQTGDMKTKIRGSMEVFSDQIQEVSYALKTAKGSTVDLQRMFQVLLNTVVNSNAEVAAGQEQALAATNDLAASRMMDISLVADEAFTTLSNLGNILVDDILPAVVSMNERQDALDEVCSVIMDIYSHADILEKSEVLNAALIHMAHVVSNHTETIEQASFTAETMSQSMDKAATTAKFLFNLFNISDQFVNWILRGVFVSLTVFLGGYGLAPSLTRNLGLVLAGIGIAQMIVQARCGSLDWDWVLNGATWGYNTGSPSSVTQLAREKVGSIVTTTVDLELA